MRIIAIANQKGGCGKTTTAMNLAASLAHRRRPTLLIDLDPQAHATLGLGLSLAGDEQPHLYHALSETSKPRRGLTDIALPVNEYLAVAPGHILLSTLEQELVGQEGGITRLQERLQWTDGRWEFIIIDTPPSLGFLTFNALRAATEIIVPIETSTFALSGVAKLQSMLELVRVKTNHRFDAVTALVTMYDERSRHARRLLGLIRSTFQHRVFTVLIRQAVTFREAVSAGQSILGFAPESRAAQSYLSLAEEVLAMTPPHAPLDPQQFFTEARDFFRRVALTLEHPSAREIYVAGDFNDWSISAQHALKRTAEGHWAAELALPPGQYRYKFIVDGQWIEDPRNPHRTPNTFGTSDSLLIIE